MRSKEIWETKFGEKLQKLKYGIEIAGMNLREENWGSEIVGVKLQEWYLREDKGEKKGELNDGDIKGRYDGFQEMG